MEPKVDQHGAKREPKLAKEPSKIQPAEQGRKSYEKREANAISFGATFDQNSLKIQFPKSSKKR